MEVSYLVLIFVMLWMTFLLRQPLQRCRARLRKENVLVKILRKMLLHCLTFQNLSCWFSRPIVSDRYAKSHQAILTGSIFYLLLLSVSFSSRCLCPPFGTIDWWTVFLHSCILHRRINRLVFLLLTLFIHYTLTNQSQTQPDKKPASFTITTHDSFKMCTTP